MPLDLSFISEKVMSPNSPKFQRVLSITEGHAIASGNSDLKDLGALELFESQRGMSRVFKQEGELLVNPCLNFFWESPVIL